MKAIKVDADNYAKLRVRAMQHGSNAWHEIDKMIAAYLEAPMPMIERKGRPPTLDDALTRHEKIVLEVLPTVAESTREAVIAAMRTEGYIREETGLWPWQIKAALRGLLRRDLVSDMGKRETGVELKGGRMEVVHEWRNARVETLPKTWSTVGINGG